MNKSSPIQFFTTKNLLELNNLCAVSDPLSAIFHAAAVIVEGDEDVRFYRYVQEKFFPDADIVFIPVFSKSRIIPVRDSLVKLMDPSRVRAIYDIDAVLMNSKNELDGALMSVMKSSPTIMELANEFHKALSSNQNWSELRKKIKTNGVDVMTASQKQSFERLTNSLQQLNIFIVPVGEVESWIGFLKDKKSKMINWFLDEMEAGKEFDLSKVENFMRNVVNFRDSQSMRSNSPFRGPLVQLNQPIFNYKPITIHNHEPVRRSDDRKRRDDDNQYFQNSRKAGWDDRSSCDERRRNDDYRNGRGYHDSYHNGRRGEDYSEYDRDRHQRDRRDDLLRNYSRPSDLRKGDDRREKRSRSPDQRENHRIGRYVFLPFLLYYLIVYS
jgi:hypothetical protein